MDVKEREGSVFGPKPISLTFRARLSVAPYYTRQWSYIEISDAVASVLYSTLSEIPTLDFTERAISLCTVYMYRDWIADEISSIWAQITQNFTND